MRHAPARRGQRGTTLVEVMIAVTILCIAAAGFAGTSNYAAGATAIGHRRTTGALMRGALIDRLNVTPRAILRGVAAASENVWIVDSCFARDSRRLAVNSGYAAAFACPASTYYRSWVRVNDNGADAWDAATNAWSVALYVEKVDPGCPAAHRFASVACLAADLLLTD